MHRFLLCDPDQRGATTGINTPPWRCERRRSRMNKSINQVNHESINQSLGSAKHEITFAIPIRPYRCPCVFNMVYDYSYHIKIMLSFVVHRFLCPVVCREGIELYCYFIHSARQHTPRNECMYCHGIDTRVEHIIVIIIEADCFFFFFCVIIFKKRKTLAIYFVIGTKCFSVGFFASFYMKKTLPFRCLSCFFCYIFFGISHFFSLPRRKAEEIFTSTQKYHTIYKLLPAGSSAGGVRSQTTDCILYPLLPK